MILKFVSCQLCGDCWSFCPDFTSGFSFKFSNFAQTSQVVIRLAEFGCEKGLNKVPGDHGPYDPATQTNNVHVIVLDTLPSREVIIDQSSANSRNFVGTDGSTHTASTNRNPALYRTGRH
jgi:hypothetical protein